MEQRQKKLHPTCMSNTSYFSFETSQSSSACLHPFPLSCTAVSIPLTEERQTLLTCLSAPIAALDIVCLTQSDSGL